jgi:hypothetical protein
MCNKIELEDTVLNVVTQAQEDYFTNAVAKTVELNGE